MTAIGEVVAASTYKTVVGVMGSQMGKTELVLNVVGHRIDDDPVPILYIAPTKSFVEKVFEPRYRVMVQTCDSLLLKRGTGAKESKTQKEIAGVKVRFAWAGSATELAGDPACLVFVDERDRMDDSSGDNSSDDNSGDGNDDDEIDNSGHGNDDDDDSDDDDDDDDDNSGHGNDDDSDDDDDDSDDDN